MAGKKSFGSALAGGAKAEIAKRAELDNRFDNVTEALEGRPNLLAPPVKPSPATAPAVAAPEVFYVEQIVAAGKASRHYTRLPIAVLDDNPLNSRTFYSEEKVRARATSIAAETQLTPALVTPNPTHPGRYILIDGHYRKRAIRHLNQADMDVCILENLTKVDFYRLARTLNAEREEESVLDVAFGYQKLLDEGLAKTDEELAAIVGESRPKVNKMLAVVALPKPVQDVIAQNPSAFGISIAYELTLYAKKVGEDKAAALAERVVAEELPFNKVEAIRKAVEQGAKPTKAMSRQHKIRQGGAEVGTLKEWDSGRIVLDIKLDDPSKRDSHLAALKRQFGLDEAA
jgi:ParB family chromosome partitioning protein